MRLLRTCVCVCALGASASALAKPTIPLGRDRYVEAFEDSSGASDRFVEFTRPGESVETWTRLVTVHWFPNERGTPAQASQRLAALAEQRDSGANPLLSENATASEAMVHFVASAPGSNMAEVNAFKYALSADGRGLVALQYAVRFVAGGTSPNEVRAARMRAATDVRSFDMALVRAIFRGAP